jgi:hypothetical protein
MGIFTKMASDDGPAWHCKGANIDSIGIEHIAVDGQRLTAEQEQSTIALIKYLLSAYKLKSKSITGHNFVAGRQTVRSCPHALFEAYDPENDSPNEDSLRAWIETNFPEFD